MRPRNRHTTLALAALTLLLASAGCGSQAGSDGGDGSGTVSPSPSSAAPSSAAPSSGCASGSGLDAADSGDTVCLAVGNTVRVGLDGTKSRPWKPIAVEGSGLKATNSGVVLLPGDANAAYQAVSAGTVRLSSSRPLCAAETGRVSCKGIQEWWVTVRVK
ncbi:hypothetical protein [Streptomyces canus]|uniref:hypothetical protein n=1 Tax=Streptomyces canus TaxID=58343 RepID=UPI00278035C2|nr:hypothetical protein [Streptomyces canus]MDQ1067733.1 hypothetical protein [Streptomyces canus]